MIFKMKYSRAGNLSQPSKAFSNVLSWLGMQERGFALCLGSLEVPNTRPQLTAGQCINWTCFGAVTQSQ